MTRIDSLHILKFYKQIYQQMTGKMLTVEKIKNKILVLGLKMIKINKLFI